MRGFQDSGTKDSTPLNSNRRQRRRTQTPAHHPRRRLQIGCLGFFSSNFTRFVIVKSQRFLESKPVMLGETPNPSPKSTSDKPTPSPETRLAAPFVQPLVISKSELQSFFSEATKYTVFGLFVLYSIGFLIWHSYLGNYGVFSFEFLQTEYFSATICYLVFVAMFALPPVLLFSRWFGKRELNGTTDPIYFIFFVWYIISQQFIGRFFPGSSVQMSQPALNLMLIFVGVLGCYVTILFIVFLNLHFQWSVSRGWKWSPITIHGFVRKWDLITLSMVVILSANFLTIHELSKTFLLVTAFLYPMLAYGIGGNAHDLWHKGGTIYKILIFTFCALIVIGNIQLFGAAQFGNISRQMGGGKPETAFVRFASQHLELATSLNIPPATNIGVSNGFVGPIEILFRTDKQVTFLNQAEADLPGFFTNDVVVNITTNFIAIVTTNQAKQLTTNTTVQVIKNVTRGTAKNSAKLTAKQIRADLIDAIIFTK